MPVNSGLFSAVKVGLYSTNFLPMLLISVRAPWIDPSLCSKGGGNSGVNTLDGTGNGEGRLDLCPSIDTIVPLRPVTSESVR